MAQSKYSPIVSTRPVKRFFVEMLTRDIALEDAILDLLDNCVDGVQRSAEKAPKDESRPYEGYFAEISITETSFTITDNCGGIPWSEHERAFRMGNAGDGARSNPTNRPLVGTYGIGMKRAIFKMGNVARISTKTKTDEYDVVIPDGWTEESENWDLKVEATPAKKLPKPGTRIHISSLNDATKFRFSAEGMVDDLVDKIATHYSVILTKGFQVQVNKQVVEPKKIAVKFAEETKIKNAEIRPYIFRSQLESDLEVFVAVGIREAIPDAETTLNEQEAASFSTDYAGWTIICNDRVVLYCNRDELTGWGTANIPKYHTQFIAISGFVEFKGNPAKLPTTTTKRGLEFSAVLYQQVLNRMREGMRMFIDYTNWWKHSEAVAKQQVLPIQSKTLAELKTAAASSLKFNATKTGLRGEIFKPDLPRPKQEIQEVRVSFYRPIKKVMRMAERKLENIEEVSEKDIPKLLGEFLFDEAYKNLGK